MVKRWLKERYAWNFAMILNIRRETNPRFLLLAKDYPYVAFLNFIEVHRKLGKGSMRAHKHDEKQKPPPAEK